MSRLLIFLLAPIAALFSFNVLAYDPFIWLISPAATAHLIKAVVDTIPDYL